MATDFDALVTELQRKTSQQPTLTAMSWEDYALLLIDGMKAFYIDFGKDELYDEEFNEDRKTIGVTYRLSQQEYIINAALIAFYQLIQQNVNDMVSYSTDSLSLSNADKPYSNISNEINKLRARQDELFQKINALEGKV